MKVIDLLNKIANGEKTPKKFKVNDRIWEWNVNSYQCELNSEFAVTGLRYDLSNLNDEIEIIEENNKIEKLDIFEEDGVMQIYDKNKVECTMLDNVDVLVINKINEIIEVINNELD